MFRHTYSSFTTHLEVDRVLSFCMSARVHVEKSQSQCSRRGLVKAGESEEVVGREGIAGQSTAFLRRLLH
jgi:hypothetical protein